MANHLETENGENGISAVVDGTRPFPRQWGGPSKKDGKYLDNKCGRVEPCFKVAEKKYPLASLWDGVESSGPAGV